MLKVTWNDFATYYFDELKNKRTSHGEQSFKGKFNLLLNFFNSRNLELNRSTIAQFYEYFRKEREWKNTTCNKYNTLFLHIKAIYKEYYNEDLNLGMLRPFQEEPTRLVESLTSKELRLLIEYNPRRKEGERGVKEKNIRMRAILTTYAFTGMRSEELCNLKWTDIKEVKGKKILEVMDEKTNKIRPVPLWKSIEIEINKLPKYSHGYIFGTPWGKIKSGTINLDLKERAKALNINKNVTCKIFRHSFDTLLSLMGGEASLPRICAITGHSIQTAYKHYIHYDVDTLFKTIEELHPLAIEDARYETIRDMFKKTIEFVKTTKLEFEQEIRNGVDTFIMKDGLVLQMADENVK